MKIIILLSPLNVLFTKNQQQMGATAMEGEYYKVISMGDAKDTTQDSLVRKLVDLIKEAPGTGICNIDAAVNQAKLRIAKEAKFDSYLDRLESRGCPKQILEIARERRGEVVDKASGMLIPEGHISFVGPIIKVAYLGYYGLMSMVRNGDNEGYTYLDPSKITDEISTPEDGLYWLYDVEDGKAMLGKSPQDAEKLIKDQGRSALTAIEIVSLGALTGVLSRHYVDAVGSRIGLDGVPYLYIDNDRPVLTWNSLYIASGYWGAASCGSRQ